MLLSNLTNGELEDFVKWSNDARTTPNLCIDRFILMHNYLFWYVESTKTTKIANAFGLSLLTFRYYVLYNRPNISKSMAKRITNYLGFLAHQEIDRRKPKDY